jgi:hypothetical protein
MNYIQWSDHVPHLMFNSSMIVSSTSIQQLQDKPTQDCLPPVSISLSAMQPENVFRSQTSAEVSCRFSCITSHFRTLKLAFCISTVVSLVVKICCSPKKSCSLNLRRNSQRLEFIYNKWQKVSLQWPGRWSSEEICLSPD